METRGAHKINAQIGRQRVVIESEFTYPNNSRPTDKSQDEFNSLEEAKNKLSSDLRTYKAFSESYTLLWITQVGAILAGSANSLMESINNNNPDFGNDVLRTFGMIGISIVTVCASGISIENKDKSANKLAALDKAEQSDSKHYQGTLPF